MTTLASILDTGTVSHPLRQKFLKWQCRTRQMMMRENDGRPDASIMPEVVLTDDGDPLGAIITVLNKAPRFSVTAELTHMAKRTNDPADIRKRAIQFFSASYFQKASEFSDILTATFPPGSPGAAQIRAHGTCWLRYNAYSQCFDLFCKTWVLAPNNPFYQATIAHNRLFNPALPADTLILGFEPDWGASDASP